jgi:hypothetical protein
MRLQWRKKTQRIVVKGPLDLIERVQKTAQKKRICEGKGRRQLPQNLGHDKALPFMKASLHAHSDEQRHVVVEMA